MPNSRSPFESNQLNQLNQLNQSNQSNQSRSKRHVSDYMSPIDEIPSIKPISDQKSKSQNILDPAMNLDPNNKITRQDQNKSIKNKRRC